MFTVYDAWDNYYYSIDKQKLEAVCHYINETLSKMSCKNWKHFMFAIDFSEFCIDDKENIEAYVEYIKLRYRIEGHFTKVSAWKQNTLNDTVWYFNWEV